MTANAAVLSKFKAAGQVQVTDTTRRFGYSGGAPYLTVMPKYAGVGSSMVPGGRLITFAPEIETVQGTYSEQKKAYVTSPRMITPGEQVLYVARKFHEGVDAGFRELKSLTKLGYGVREATETTPEHYFDEGPQYFDLLHPEIECSAGLESQFISRAEGNVGATWFQACPTCRLQDLEQNAPARIASSHLDRLVLENLRQELIAACRSAINFAERQIDRLNADLEKRGRGEHGRTTRNEADYIYLQMVHREAKEVKQLSPQEIVTEAAKAAAAGVIAAQASVPPPVVAPQEEVDPELQQFLAEKFAEWKEQKAATTKTKTKQEKKDGGNNDPSGNEGNA
jgi:hypothetical protein